PRGGLQPRRGAQPCPAPRPEPGRQCPPRACARVEQPAVTAVEGRPDAYAPVNERGVGPVRVRTIVVAAVEERIVEECIVVERVVVRAAAPERVAVSEPNAEPDAEAVRPAPRTPATPTAPASPTPTRIVAGTPVRPAVVGLDRGDGVGDHVVIEVVLASHGLHQVDERSLPVTAALVGVERTVVPVVGAHALVVLERA